MNARDAAWRRVFERIVAGLAHDLNGRLTAFDGLLRVAEMEPQPAGWLERFLRVEVDKLETTVRLMRALPRLSRDDAPEALSLVDVVRLAIELCALDSEMDRELLNVTSDAQPLVLAPPDTLLELLILCISMWVDRKGDRAITMAVRQPNEASVEFEVQAAPAGAPSEEIVSAVSELAAALNGQFRVQADRGVLTLPSLQHSRAGSH